MREESPQANRQRCVGAPATMEVAASASSGRTDSGTWAPARQSAPRCSGRCRCSWLASWPYSSVSTCWLSWGEKEDVERLSISATKDLCFFTSTTGIKSGDATVLQRVFLSERIDDHDVDAGNLPRRKYIDMISCLLSKKNKKNKRRCSYCFRESLDFGEVSTFCNSVSSNIL